MDLVPGLVIAGKYRVQSRIGAGAMGQVWAGIRLDKGSRVAVKLLLPAASLNREVVARFRREAEVLTRVQSPHVARVLDFASDATFGLLLIMELIEGEQMMALLTRMGKLTIEAALIIGADVARGLSHLHDARIVHRDLKPSNIVLRAQPGEMPRAVLIDFGVSRILSGPGEEDEVTAITKGDMVLGTLEYIAPEQILAPKAVNGAADLYALGTILYRAIAGHHVYGNAAEAALVASKLSTDAPALPTGRDDAVAVRTSALVARLLSRKVRERASSAREVLQEIEAILAMAFGEDGQEDDIATIYMGGPASPRAPLPPAGPIAAEPSAPTELSLSECEVLPAITVSGDAFPPCTAPQPALADSFPRVTPAGETARVQAVRPQAEWKWLVIALVVAIAAGSAVSWLLLRNLVAPR